MREDTCGHTVVDADGIEEPCGLPVSGWRYYEGYEHEDTLQRVCADHEQWALSNGIRARDAEVATQARAEALAGFEREDVAPFHGHGFTDPGYWRLVGPKHYKPLPPPPTDAEARAIRERFGLEPEAGESDA